MSIEVKHPEPHNVLAMKKIWQACFGDTMDYIDFFFEKCFNPKHALVAYYDYKPVAMLFLLPTTLTIAQKQYQGAYVYAVATKPEYRGKGIMKRMEQKAVEVSKQAGLQFLCLVPQTKSLYKMYEKIGYKTAFYLSEKRYIPLGTPNYDQIKIEECAKDEFIDLRKQFIGRLPSSVDFDDFYQKYRYDELAYSGFQLLKAESESEVGYLVGYREKDKFVIKETSIPQELLPKVLDCVAERYHVNFVKVRGLKGPVDKIVPFGMYKSLSEEIDDVFVKSKNPYMNLMLDYFEGESL